MTDEELMKFCDEIYFLLGQGKYYLVDTLLGFGNINLHMPTIMIVGILRYTFPYRNRLDNWLPFLKRTKRELDLRGEDTDQLLIGLMQFLD